MKTMVCMGDSLTEGVDIPAGHTWPALVSNALDLDIINCGIGGDTTQGMLARFYPEVVISKPEFVLIMGGTNDLWWGWEVNTILGNLFSMIYQARHHGIVPVIGLPLPVDVPAAQASDFAPPQGGYGRFAEKLEEMAEELTGRASESEVAIIDLHRLFLADSGQVHSDLFLPDGLHANRAGHLVIAKKIIAVFRQDFIF